jgi:hypothetical protein
MTCGWYLDGDLVRNPRGEPVAKILPGLSAIKRQELREHLEDAVNKAIAQTQYEFEHAYGYPEDFDKD